LNVNLPGFSGEKNPSYAIESQVALNSALFRKFYKEGKDSIRTGGNFFCFQ
jgi:hypothetical protein